MTMDATPRDLYNDQAPIRYQKFAPSARKVLLLRDPASRVISHLSYASPRSAALLHEINDLLLAAVRSFSSSLAGSAAALPATNEGHSAVYFGAWRACQGSNPARRPEMKLVCNAIARSLYAYQVSHWWRNGAIHPNNTLVAVAKCARQHQPRFWAEVVDFLADGHPGILAGAAGHKACLAAQRGFRNQNPAARLPVRDGTRRRLEAFFAPHNRLLWDFLATRFERFQPSPCLDWMG